MECLLPGEKLWEKVVMRATGEELESLAEESGLTPLREAAAAAVKAGITSPSEIRRVLGPD